MTMTRRERQKQLDGMTREQHIEAMEDLLDKIEKEKRLFTAPEQRMYDEHEFSLKLLNAKPQGELRTIGKPPAYALPRGYSLQRVLRALSGDRTADIGLELEVSQDLARHRKQAPEGILVPFSALRTRAQDGTSTAPDTGQSLVGEDRRGDLLMQIDDAILRPPVAQRLGVTMISTDEDKVIIPRHKKALNANWIARDGNASASADAEFDSLTIQPTTLALLFEMKRSLVYSIHPNAEQLLLDDARRAIELALDNAILSGSGAANQPSGFSTAATATTVSGAISSSNASTHPKKILNELQSYLKDADPNIKWVLHPLCVGMLRMAPAFTGATGTTVISQDGTTLEGREFVETYALGDPAGGPPAVATGLVGLFNEMVAVTFGPSLELVANAYADSVFSKGSVLVRGLLDYNQAHRDPKRVRKFTAEGI